jgi:integrase
MCEFGCVERDPVLADAVLVLASTGMRKGELLALQWGDVDHDRREVHVAAAVTDGGPGKGVMRKSTKRNDWRDVPLNARAIEAVRRQLARYVDGFGREPLQTDFVFSKPGEPGVAVPAGYVHGSVVEGNRAVGRDVAATAPLRRDHDA